MTRHEARELAFVLIFEKSFQEDVTVVELIENALELEIFPTNAFAENLAKKVYANLEEIDSLINDNLVGWSAKRISKVSRAILRLAVCELLFGFSHFAEQALGTWASVVAAHELSSCGGRT